MAVASSDVGMKTIVTAAGTFKVKNENFARVDDAPGKHEGGIKRFTIKSSQRITVAYKVSMGTPPQRVLDELLKTGGGGHDPQPMTMPPMMISALYEEQALKEYIQNLNPEGSMSLYKTWGVDEDVAQAAYFEKVKEVFGSVALAAVRSGAWLFTGDMERGEGLHLGMKYMNETKPVEYYDAILINGLYYQKDLALIEACESVVEGGEVVVVSKDPKKWGPHLRSSDHASHVFVFEVEAEFKKFAKYLQALIPSTGLFMRGDWSWRRDSKCFSMVLAESRRNMLIVNLYNAHINSIHLAGLLLQDMPESKEKASLRLIADNDEKHWESVTGTKDEVSLTEKGTGNFFLRKSNALNKEFNTMDKPAKNSEKFKAGESYEGQQLPLNLASHLPGDIPFDQFITFDMRTVRGMDVTMKLFEYISTGISKAQLRNSFGGQEAERRTLVQACDIAATMEQEAQRQKNLAIVLQFFIAVLSFGGVTLGVICSESKASHMLMIATTVLPIAVTCLVSLGAFYSPLAKWAISLQSAAEVHSVMFYYRTSTGMFAKGQTQQSKPTSASMSGAKDQQDATDGQKKKDMKGNAGASNAEKKGQNKSKTFLLAETIGGIRANMLMSEYKTAALDQVVTKLDKAEEVYGPRDPQSVQLLCCDGDADLTHAPCETGLGALSGDEYLALRARPLERDFRERAAKLSRELFRLRVCVILATSSASVLGILSLQGWSPLAFAAASNLQAWIDFQNLPSRLQGLNMALGTLSQAIVCFDSLDMLAQRLPRNINLLVTSVEGVANAEMAAIYQKGDSTKSKGSGQDSDDDGDDKTDK